MVEASILEILQNSMHMKLPSDWNELKALLKNTQKNYKHGGHSMSSPDEFYRLDKYADEEEFHIPAGYRVWCHKCGRPPYNIVTDGIPGKGFHSIEESQQHEKEVHSRER